MNQQEWRNQASLANYPFVSNASRTSANGNSVVKTSDIVDAHLVARTPEERGFHIYSMSGSSDTISGTIQSNMGVFGTFSIAVSDMPDGVAQVVDAAGIGRGVIVFGREDQLLFDLLTSGESIFLPNALAFHECTVFHPPVKRVATVKINDIPLYGRVRLKAGTGIRFELVNEGGRDVIVVHATGAQVEKDCGEGKPIKNFNSVLPDKYGSIFMRPAPYMTPEQATSLRQLIKVRAADGENGIIISLSELDN